MRFILTFLLFFFWIAPAFSGECSTGKRIVKTLEYHYYKKIDKLTWNPKFKPDRSMKCVGFEWNGHKIIPNMKMDARKQSFELIVEIHW